ncbi:MAG: hypothetical protein COB14_09105 [Alphaproteobacteria bacterium]|nr:MAG: hypothetical protein COB14_09105 [Alphaproteobacteria bacterium]
MKQCDRPKVLFILPTLGAGGAERILITLMNNLDRTRFQPEFLALNDAGPIKEWVDKEILFHSFKNRTIKTSIFKLYTLIKNTQPDVIFTTMVHSNALALLMKLFFPHIRVIVREAALPSVLISRYGIKGRFCTLVYKLLYGRADVVISNCSQMIEDFTKTIKISTKNHRILFNPVDTQRLFSSIPSQFIMPQKRESTLHFVAVGRLAYEKGYDRLLHALVDFKPKKNWRIDLIGEGAYRETLMRLIKELRLEEHVFLQGYHSNPWIIAAQADCLLLPSRWEGMPNVVLEGFSCGIPAIAMREAGGITDIEKYADDRYLSVVDTVDDFVCAMGDIKITPKTCKAQSVLPDAFSLACIMQEFDEILCGAE